MKERDSFIEELQKINEEAKKKKEEEERETTEDTYAMDMLELCRAFFKQPKSDD